MNSKPYIAKSLAGAQAEVRNLRRQIRKLDDMLNQAWPERRLLAMLAADGPCFSNPIHVMEAKRIRDEILKKECRLSPTGKPL